MIKETIATLSAKKNSLRCPAVTTLITALGFEITSGKSEGHKIVTHRNLSEFTTGSYNCEGGRGQVKLPYILKLINIIREHEEGLIVFLRDRS